MPIYSADRESEGGIPQLAQDFFDKIGAANAVLISSAEHNGFPTFYENFDPAAGSLTNGDPDEQLRVALSSLDASS
jgi:hypothetical protein